MKTIRCEFCRRWAGKEPYIINDQGVARAFCGQRHADKYILQKYQMALPLDFGDGAPFYEYQTDNNPFAKRGVTNTQAVTEPATNGGEK